jgi:hypothetical protein
MDWRQWRLQKDNTGAVGLQVFYPNKFHSSVCTICENSSTIVCKVPSFLVAPEGESIASVELGVVQLERNTQVSALKAMA